MRGRAATAVAVAVNRTRINIRAVNQMAIEWYFVIAGPTVAWVAWVILLSRRGSNVIGAPVGQVRRIRVNAGYQPTEVHVRAGAPTRLIFRREETAPCSERVVFPDFGISVTLPPFEDVAVDLPAVEPGEHEFMCQMKMLHGTLVVDPANTDRRAQRNVVAR
jgi:plastocyanin domain-containing protein